LWQFFLECVWVIIDQVYCFNTKNVRLAPHGRISANWTFEKIAEKVTEL